MFASKNLGMRAKSPPAIAPSCSASHARTHMVNSGSPRSDGTSRVRPRTSGHVMTSVMSRYAAAAIAACRAEAGRAKAGHAVLPSSRKGESTFTDTRPEFLNKHVQNGGGRYRENRAYDAQQ